MADWGGLATIQRPPGLVWGQPGEGLDGLFTPRGGDWGGLGGTGTRVGTVWPTVAPHPRAMWPQTRLAGSLQVNEVVFSPSESHCATCCDDGSMRVWSLTSMELVIQLQVLNQSCFCLAWSPPSCGRPEQQRVAAGHSEGTLRVFSLSRVAMSSRCTPTWLH